MQNEIVGRAASDAFEVEAVPIRVDRQRRWKLLRWLSFFAGDVSPSWPVTQTKFRLTIRERPSGTLVIEVAPADPDLVELARRQLATLDVEEFRRSWSSEG